MQIKLFFKKLALLLPALAAVALVNFWIDPVGMSEGESRRDPIARL